MLREELEDLIQRLRPEGSNPFFGIYDGSSEAAYIRANREGLQLFARELLRASLTLDYHTDGTPIPLSRHALPIGGEVRLTHVQPCEGAELLLPEPPQEPGMKQHLARWGVILGALVVCVSTLIGFYTLVRWLF
jgi:hypothetical protein